MRVYFLNVGTVTSLIGLVLVVRIAAAQEVPGQFIVTLKESPTPQADISAMASGVAGAKVARLAGSANTILLKVDPSDANRLKAIRGALATNNHIVAFEPNRYIRPCVTPNDPKFLQQSYLTRLGVTTAWDKTTGSADVIVAVIDTGIFVEHEDLTGNFWANPSPSPATRPIALPADEPYYPRDVAGWNFPGNNTDLEPELVPTVLFPSIPQVCQSAVLDLDHKLFQQHGSHVAGLIGAVGNNGLGGCGIAWSVKLMPLKVLDGPESIGTTGDAIQAINYAVAHKARIINMSWGLTDYSDDLSKAISKASDAGILMVVAAGNYGNDLTNGHYFYPASFKLPNMISVAATDDQDQVIASSNYGATTVDVAAPGDSLISTVPTWDGSSAKPHSGYAPLTGTSMAAALVTGEATLLMAKYPTLSASEVRQIIFRTCDPLTGDSAGKVQNGRINVGSALKTLPLPDSVAARLESLPAEQALSIQQALTDEKRAHLFVLGNSAISGGSENVHEPSMTKQDLLVQIKQGNTIDELSRSIESHGGKLLNYKPVGGGLYQVQVEGTGNGIRVLESIRGDKAVANVEKNQTIRPQDQP